MQVELSPKNKADLDLYIFKAKKVFPSYSTSITYLVNGMLADIIQRELKRFDEPLTSTEIRNRPPIYYTDPNTEKFLKRVVKKLKKP